MTGYKYTERGDKKKIRELKRLIKQEEAAIADLETKRDAINTPANRSYYQSIIWRAQGTLARLRKLLEYHTNPNFVMDWEK